MSLAASPAVVVVPAFETDDEGVAFASGRGAKRFKMCFNLTFYHISLLASPR